MVEFIVLGAGMIGVSSALALQADGHKIVLVDRRGAGEETSCGNAGLIQVEAAEPYALPTDITTLLKYTTGMSNDVYWCVNVVLLNGSGAVVLFSKFYFSQSTKVSHFYSQIMSRSTADHEPLIRDSQSNYLNGKDVSSSDSW